LNLREKLERKDFLRIVEVFPPNFAAKTETEPLLGLRQKMRDLLERVRKIQDLADAILVADVKDLARLKLGTIYSAAMIQEVVSIQAVPVITARDSNRGAIRSSILTALSLGLDSLMFVWGDRYSADDGSKNVYDYGGVGELIGEAEKLAERAGVRLTILAPIDIAKLDTERGRRVARARLKSGAAYLLAQPPTVDVTHTLPLHSGTLRRLGLASRVLPNVFPFRSKEDIEYCRRKFAWDLPPHLDEIAGGGEPELLKEARMVADRLQTTGFQGVYVSTRGRPELARFILH